MYVQAQHLDLDFYDGTILNWLTRLTHKITYEKMAFNRINQ